MRAFRILRRDETEMRTTSCMIEAKSTLDLSSDGHCVVDEAGVLMAKREPVPDHITEALVKRLARTGRAT